MAESSKFRDIMGFEIMHTINHYSQESIEWVISGCVKDWQRRYYIIKLGYVPNKTIFYNNYDNDLDEFIQNELLQHKYVENIDSYIDIARKCIENYHDPKYGKLDININIYDDENNDLKKSNDSVSDKDVSVSDEYSLIKTHSEDSSEIKDESDKLETEEYESILHEPLLKKSIESMQKINDVKRLDSDNSKSSLSDPDSEKSINKKLDDLIALDFNNSNSYVTDSESNSSELCDVEELDQKQSGLNDIVFEDSDSKYSSTSTSTSTSSSQNILLIEKNLIDMMMIYTMHNTEYDSIKLIVQSDDYVPDPRTEKCLISEKAYKMMQLLIDNNKICDMDECLKDAVLTRDKKMVELLIENGADFRIIKNADPDIKINITGL